MSRTVGIKKADCSEMQNSKGEAENRLESVQKRFNDSNGSFLQLKPSWVPGLFNPKPITPVFRFNKFF